MSDKTPLNIGMIGYGFMGLAHSNAYFKVGNFFDTKYQPVLKAACARNQESVQAFADNWGYESIETDWRALLERDDIDAVDTAVSEECREGVTQQWLACQSLVLLWQVTGKTVAGSCGDDQDSNRHDACLV